MKRNFIVAVVVLGTTSGCDSLRARMTAQEGVDLYKKGQVAEAVDKFQAAQKLDDKIPPVELNLGFSSLSLYQAQPTTPVGKQAAQTAIGAFEKYLQLKPNEERAKGFLVQTFVDTGRYEEAVTYFKPEIESAATPKAKVSEALGTLGAIAAKTGRFEDAKSWFEKRIAADPDNSDARVAVGVLIWDRLKTHPPDVAPTPPAPIAGNKKGAAPPPPPMVPTGNGINGQDRIKLADEAITTLAQAIKLAPNAPNAYTYTNLVYRERALAEPDDDKKRSDLEQANKFFLQAVEMQKGKK